MLLRENAGSVLCCLQANGGPVLLPSTPAVHPPPNVNRSRGTRQQRSVCVSASQGVCHPPPGQPASSKQPALQLEKTHGMQSQTRPPARTPRARSRPRPAASAASAASAVSAVSASSASLEHPRTRRRRRRRRRRRTPAQQTQQWRAGDISAAAATSAIPHAGTSGAGRVAHGAGGG